MGMGAAASNATTKRRLVPQDSSVFAMQPRRQQRRQYACHVTDAIHLAPPIPFNEFICLECRGFLSRFYFSALKFYYYQECPHFLLFLIQRSLRFIRAFGECICRSTIGGGLSFAFPLFFFSLSLHSIHRFILFMGDFYLGNSQLFRQNP